MRLGLLGCAAALTLVGTAAAQAEMIYVTEPGAIATASYYTHSAPPEYAYTAPFAAPRYVLTEPAPTVIAEQPASYVVESPATAIIDAPLVIAPRERVIERERVVVAPRERVIARERVVPDRRAFTRDRLVAPRGRMVERERVIVEPREEVVVAPRQSGIVTTGFSTTRSCSIDLNGFERCY